MIPYILVYSYIIVSLYFENNNHMVLRYEKKFGRNILKVFSYEHTIILMFLFAALRGNGDGDYFNYLNAVKYVDNISFLFHPINYPFEFGFRLLSYFANLMNLNPQSVIIMMNLISFSMVNKFIRKRSKKKVLSLFIFFPIMLLFDMHHSRSAIAMSSGLMFYDSLEERSYFKALLYFLTGFFFHKSSVVTLLLLSVQRIVKYTNKTNLDLKKIIILVTSILFITIIFFDPLKIFVNMFNNPITFKLYGKLNAYLMNERWSYKFSLIDPRLILSIFILLYFSSFYSKTNNTGRGYIIIQFLSVLSILLLRQSTILVMRVYNFFNLFLIVSIPFFIEDKNKTFFYLSWKNMEKKINNRYVYVFIIMAFIIYTLALITKQVPYKLSLI